MTRHHYPYCWRLRARQPRYRPRHFIPLVLVENDGARRATVLRRLEAQRAWLGRRLARVERDLVALRPAEAEVHDDGSRG